MAEIDEITIYGMLTAGGLVCKCINVFAYKSASAYLPLRTLCQETKPELTLATKVISKCRKIIKIADRQCAVWYITLLNALSWSMWPETGKEWKSTIDSSLDKLMAVLWGQFVHREAPTSKSYPCQKSCSLFGKYTGTAICVGRKITEMVRTFSHM